jgi:DNA topoisomerase-1
MIIYRKKINEEKKIYEYYANKDKKDKKVIDKKVLEYINNLTIPPAYNDVEIFIEKSPKILFQGLDSKGRLQQIYSPKWREKADREKFKALIDFGYKLPQMTLKMQEHIKSPQRSKEKIISIILRIVSLCGFRIGSIKYQKLYGSVGLITLDSSHIKFIVSKKTNELECHINFIGKKGVKNDCVVKDKKIINEIELLSKGKGKKEYIFTYFDTQTKEDKHITANDINDWLKTYNPNFTSKFFRTFDVNSMLIGILDSTKPQSLTLNQRKKKIIDIIKDISCQINNTPTVCKKSYLNPDLIHLYIEHPKKYNDLLIKGDSNSHLKFIHFLESLYF